MTYHPHDEKPRKPVAANDNGMSGAILPAMVALALVAMIIIFSLFRNDGMEPSASAPPTTTGQAITRPSPMQPNENYR